MQQLHRGVIRSEITVVWRLMLLLLLLRGGRVRGVVREEISGGRCRELPHRRPAVELAAGLGRRLLRRRRRLLLHHLRSSLTRGVGEKAEVVAGNRSWARRSATKNPSRLCRRPTGEEWAVTIGFSCAYWPTRWLMMADMRSPYKMYLGQPICLYYFVLGCTLYCKLMGWLWTLFETHCIQLQQTIWSSLYLRCCEMKNFYLI
jgi:hypothetical protein